MQYLLPSSGIIHGRSLDITYILHTYQIFKSVCNMYACIKYVMSIYLVFFS